MSAVKQVIAINENEATRPEGTQAGSVPVPGEIGGTSSELVRALRRRLPDERRAITHHFSIAGQEGYLTVGVYDDGSPGEIFVRMAKEGSTISGLMDSIATLVSLALQHGVPLRCSAPNSVTRALSPAAGQESKDWLCHVTDGLSLPLDGAQVSEE